MSYEGYFAATGRQLLHSCSISAACENAIGDVDQVALLADPVPSITLAVQGVWAVDNHSASLLALEQHRQVFRHSRCLRRECGTWANRRCQRHYERLLTDPTEGNYLLDRPSLGR